MSDDRRPDEETPVVYVVDDDEGVRDSLLLLVESVGLAGRGFADGTAFLEAYRSGGPGCVVLDIRMPGISGLDVQERLTQQGADLPIVFVTGHGDVPMAVRAMRAGAVDFLEKPFSDQELLDRIHEALDRDARQRRDRDARHEVSRRLERLTPRETEVLRHVVSGEANKVIANRLKLSQRTVEIHRAHIMQKMKARSLAELVRMTLFAEV